MDQRLAALEGFLAARICPPSDAEIDAALNRLDSSDPASLQHTAALLAARAAEIQTRQGETADEFAVRMRGQLTDSDLETLRGLSAAAGNDFFAETFQAAVTDRDALAQFDEGNLFMVSDMLDGHLLDTVTYGERQDHPLARKIDMLCQVAGRYRAEQYRASGAADLAMYTPEGDKALTVALDAVIADIRNGEIKVLAVPDGRVAAVTERVRQAIDTVTAAGHGGAHDTAVRETIHEYLLGAGVITADDCLNI